MTSFIREWRYCSTTIELSDKSRRMLPYMENGSRHFCLRNKRDIKVKLKATNGINVLEYEKEEKRPIETYVRLCETTFSLTDIPYYEVLTKDYSLDKQQTSYDDSLDALRLSLKGYLIE
jgi:hypothetical protein